MFAGWRLGAIALEIFGYGYTNDGDCTNEYASSMSLPQNSISWMSGQINRVEHEWGRLTTLSGDLSQDYKAIQPFIEQTIESGMSKVINQSTLGPVVEFTHNINSQQVVVRVVQTAMNAYQIVDAWVVK